MSETSKSSYKSHASGSQTDNQSLPEEFRGILERVGSEEEEFTKEECLCSFFDQEHIEKLTLEEYHKEKLKESPLFSNVLVLDKDEDRICIAEPSDDPDASILVSGFGIRNLKSLQNALLSDNRKRLYELYKSQKSMKKEDQSDVAVAVAEKTEKTKIKTSGRSVETETESSVSLSSDSSVQQQKLRYLMGLEADIFEEESYPQDEDLVREMLVRDGEEDKFIFGITSTMKSAQVYLRAHRIFDFFQFIIAHLLSAAPENPINFILVLLNQMLLYRAGTGDPPLLYKRKHIEQLFSLMDRMNTGFIEMKQYVSGMNTLGICEYNKEPQLSEDGLVYREVFVHEALESETALFNDLIKRKWIGNKPNMKETLSDMSSLARSFVSGTNFIPSDVLLKKTKHYPSTESVEENENEGA